MPDHTTTDGRTIVVADFCPYCRMDTAGRHEAWCPLPQSELDAIIRPHIVTNPTRPSTTGGYGHA